MKQATVRKNKINQIEKALVLETKKFHVIEENSDTVNTVGIETQVDNMVTWYIVNDNKHVQYYTEFLSGFVAYLQDCEAISEHETINA